MPRYVILEHDHPRRHWDFMLEAGPVLRTWRLLAPPETGRTVEAEPTFDHRLVYLDYEGPISGGRGMVSRWDWGTFTWITAEANALTVDLTGHRLSGMAHLRHRDAAWTFEFTGKSRLPVCLVPSNETP